MRTYPVYWVAVLALFAALAAAQSASSPLTGGGDVSIAKEADVWRITVKGPSVGLASLCVGDNTSVRILHASAAVGQGVYARSGDSWVLKSGFDFKLRQTRQGPPPEADRRAFFTTMGWLANADSRGDQPREFLVRAEERNQFLGVTFFSTNEPMALSHWPAGMDDDCRAITVAQGYLPDTAQFRPASWHRLR